MKAILKYAGWFIFNFSLMTWGMYRLADGVCTGTEMLQTALVLINLFSAACFGAALVAAWKTYRKTPS